MHILNSKKHFDLFFAKNSDWILVFLVFDHI